MAMPKKTSNGNRRDTPDVARKHEPTIRQLEERFFLEPRILQLIQKALDLPTQLGMVDRLVEITPLNFLLLCAHEEKVKPGFHPDTAYLAPDICNWATLTDDRFTKLLVDALVCEPAGDKQQGGLRISTSMANTFDFALKLALSTTRDKSVLMRHILASICLRLPALAHKENRGLLDEMRLNFDQLALSIEKHILHTYPSDNAHAWKSIFEGKKKERTQETPLPRPDEPVAPPPQVQQIQVGAHLNLDRTASDDELALDVDEYAELLKDFFSQAGEGELCFALYGPWGRGKTFQARRLARKLEADEKTHYTTVFFSAWKYPNVPEVWIHLYETFAQIAYPKNLLVSLPRLFRAAIAKNGAWQIISALLILALALLPKGDLRPAWREFAHQFDFLLGMGSLGWLGMFISGTWQTTSRLSKEFLNATHHTEKLGLQATIGNDLRALLVGWMPQKPFPFYFALCLVPLVLGAIATSFWWRLGDVSSVLPWLFYFGLFLILLLGLLFLVYGGKPPSRLLLVVDDLDRCRPEQLLSVVESIKLLVEDDDVSNRVQVAMLLEEDVLKQAILEKYRKLGATDKNVTVGPQWTDDRICRENCEKLFTAHLRMPPLESYEAEDVLKKILTRNGKITAKQQDEKSPPQKRQGEPGYSPITPFPPNGHRPDPDDKPLPVKPDKHPGRKEPQPMTPANMLVPAITFSKDEIDALSSALPELRKRYQAACGPRAIRAFIFRYQLARLLLKHWNQSWDPKALAMGLARGMAGKGSSKVEETQASKLERVIAQVS